MTTAFRPSDLSHEDFVLSHFTLNRHHDITQRLDAAAGAGCRGIGIYIRDFQRLEADGISGDLTRMLDDRGLCLAEIDALRSWDSPESARTADAVDQEAAAFRIADQFGCRSLHVLGRSNGTTQDDGEAFGALCDRARDHGLLVALEFVPSTNIATAADALRIVEAAGRDNGGLCVDIWHHRRGMNDLELITAIPGDKVIDVQMSDGPLTPMLDDYEQDTLRNRLPPGEGNMDLNGFVTAIRSTGTTAPWAIEVCNEATWETDGAAFVARCAHNLRRVLAPRD